MTICNKCKTEIREGEPVTIIHWSEGDEREHRDCIATLRDRAETAEAELAEATETNEENSRISEENSRFIDDIIDALGYTIRGDEAFLDEIVDLAAALRAELAEARAQLDKMRTMPTYPLTIERVELKGGKPVTSFFAAYPIERPEPVTYFDQDDEEE